MFKLRELFNHLFQIRREILITRFAYFWMKQFIVFYIKKFTDLIYIRKLPE